MKNFLAGFNRGKLGPEELGRGMHLCFINARALVEDAEVLLPKSPGRALSLAILALEEIGKIFLLCNAAAKALTGPVTWERINRKLRSHQHKQKVFATYGHTLLDKLGYSYEIDLPSGLVPLLDRMKQLGLYVDCFEGKFVAPEEFGRDNVEWSKWVLSLAKERLKSLAPLHSSKGSSIQVAKAAGTLLKAMGSTETAEDVRNALQMVLKEMLRIPGGHEDVTRK